MTVSALVSRSFAILCLASTMNAGLALAQDKAYEPTVGQPGKDVMWVPTVQTLVDRMLDMARITVDDYVIDLGSGDGRTVITAAKRGATAHGIEYNPDMVALSRRNAQAAGVADKATFVQGDIFASDFSKASVITLFLLTELNARLRPTLLDMKPGTRVVSNSFNMGDWTPDDKVVVNGNCVSHCQAFFWIVPAKVAGTWQLPEGELKLAQEFQMLTGTLGAAPITEGRMAGDRIRFKVGEQIFTGKVEGGRMEGVFVTETKWQATRR